MENCLLYDAIHDLSIWLRTGFNQADINRFRSHTGKKLYFNCNVKRQSKNYFQFVNKFLMARINKITPSTFALHSINKQNLFWHCSYFYNDHRKNPHSPLLKYSQFKTLFSRMALKNVLLKPIFSQLNNTQFCFCLAWKYLY